MSEHIQQYSTNSAEFKRVNKRAYSQNLMIFKSCGIAGFAFLLIFGLAYGIYALLIKQNIQNYNNLLIIGTVGLFVFIGISFYASFKRGQLSSGVIAALYISFIIAFSVTFASYFVVLDTETLLFAFLLTGLALLVTAGIGFSIKDRAAMALSKVFMIMFFAYFIFIMATSLMLFFVFPSSPWYYILINAFMGIIIFISNILTFWNLKKTAEYSDLSNISDKEANKLTWMLGLNVLFSIVNTFMWMIRILLITKR